MTGKLDPIQQRDPGEFAFTAANLAQAQEIAARYPERGRQSALMPLLTLAQKQCGGWLPKSAMDYVAALLEMPPVRVYEVASFYTMYNLHPVGRHVIEVCTTTPCWLRGSEKIVAACEEKLGISAGETTPDGEFTLREAECLGACVNAPMCRVNEVYYEDLTHGSMTNIIETLARGEQPKPGPQSERKSTEPAEMEYKGRKT